MASPWTLGVRVSRRLVSLTLDTLEELPRRCRACVHWELDPIAGERSCADGTAELAKESWVSQTLLEWGSCGKLAYVDEVPAGFVMYAPPAYVPRSTAFPTSPVSADAVLLTTAYVVPSFVGSGLGRMLVQGVARELTKRGVKAIEAFGDAKWEQPSCVTPVDFFLSVGFKTIKHHPRYPRLRLELRTALDWKSDVEYALEKLLGTMSPDPMLHPSQFLSKRASVGS